MTDTEILAWLIANDGALGIYQAKQWSDRHPPAHSKLVVSGGWCSCCAEPFKEMPEGVWERLKEIAQTLPVWIEEQDDHQAD